MTKYPNDNPIEQSYTFFETCLSELNDIDPTADSLIFLAFTNNPEAPVVFVAQNCAPDDLCDAAYFLQKEFIRDLVHETVQDTTEFDDLPFDYDEDQMTMEDYDYE